MTPAAARRGKTGLSVVVLACHEPEDREELDSIVQVLFMRHPRLQAPKTQHVTARKKGAEEGADSGAESDDPDVAGRANPLITNAKILLGAERREWFEYLCRSQNLSLKPPISLRLALFGPILGPVFISTRDLEV